MHQTELTPENAQPADLAKSLNYTTKYGEVHLREDKLVAFPQGLFGFADCSVFGFAKLPNVDESPLLLMQCVNSPEVAFMVADPAVLGLEIALEDKQIALKETQMPAEHTQFLAILTMYDHGDGYYVTANLRAPILVNSATRVAKQHILTNKAYSTQEKI